MSGSNIHSKVVKVALIPIWPIVYVYIYGSDLWKSMSALNQRNYLVSVPKKYFQKHQSLVIKPARDDIKYLA